jgi:hypothetical protein
MTQHYQFDPPSMKVLVPCMMLILLPVWLQATDPVKEKSNSQPFSIRTAQEVLVVASGDGRLELQVFNLQGERIPCTVWKSKNEQQVIYETGYDLDKGVYLIRIQSGEAVSFCKLVRK